MSDEKTIDGVVSQTMGGIKRAAKVYSSKFSGLGVSADAAIDSIHKAVTGAIIDLDRRGVAIGSEGYTTQLDESVRTTLDAVIRNYPEFSKAFLELGVLDERLIADRLQASVTTGHITRNKAVAKEQNRTEPASEKQLASILISCERGFREIGNALAITQAVRKHSTTEKDIYAAAKSVLFDKKPGVLLAIIETNLTKAQASEILNKKHELEQPLTKAPATAKDPVTEKKTEATEQKELDTPEEPKKAPETTPDAPLTTKAEETLEQGKPDKMSELGKPESTVEKKTEPAPPKEVLAQKRRSLAERIQEVLDMSSTEDRVAGFVQLTLDIARKYPDKVQDIANTVNDRLRSVGVKVTTTKSGISFEDVSSGVDLQGIVGVVLTSDRYKDITGRVDVVIPAKISAPASATHAEQVKGTKTSTMESTLRAFGEGITSMQKASDKFHHAAKIYGNLLVAARALSIDEAKVLAKDANTLGDKVTHVKVDFQEKDGEIKARFSSEKEKVLEKLCKTLYRMVKHPKDGEERYKDLAGSFTWETERSIAS